MRLHIIGRSKAFDLFPRTHKGKNRCVLRKKHALINSREPLLKSDINLEQSSHVETVVLLSREKVDGHIEIDLDVDTQAPGALDGGIRVQGRRSGIGEMRERKAYYQPGP